MPALPTFDRPLADSLIRPLDRTPVLSVVIPTFHRPLEMTLAVTSIADQIDAALAGKVEIIVSDNASGPESHAALKRLAARYPSLSYYIHAEDYGGPYQICSAPHRARGRWTLVFGDDDVLGQGGLEPIVALLEREQPAFLSVNRQVWNMTLDQQIAATKHTAPDMRFDSFLDFLGVFGFDQLSFLSSQIYDTQIARAVDPQPYLDSLCRYCQLAYYVEAFHDRPTVYHALPSVWHRWDPGAAATHAANFHHLATQLPELVQAVADRLSLPAGLFERIGGRRSLLGPEVRRITFVDNILENLWRCAAAGAVIPEEEWDALQRIAADWGPGRADALQQVRQIHTQLAGVFDQFQALVANHRMLTADGPPFDPDVIPLIQQSETAVLQLQGYINDARKTAFELAGGYN